MADATGPQCLSDWNHTEADYGQQLVMCASEIYLSTGCPKKMLHSELVMYHFGTLTSQLCLAIFGTKRTIFGPSPVMNGGPQSQKRLITRSHVCGLLVEPQNAPFVK